MRVSRRHAVGLLVGGLVVAGLLVSPDAAVERLETVLYSPWFPAVLVGLYLVRPLLAWPIAAIAVLVGYRYGVAVGVPVALTATVTTSLLPFAAARRFDVGGGFAGRVAAGSDRYFSSAGGLRGVVAARLAPLPTEVVSIAAGLGDVSVGAFVVGTAVGQLPWTVVAVTAGHSMTGLSAADAGPSLWLVVAGALGSLLLVARPLYRLVSEGERSGPDALAD